MAIKLTPVTTVALLTSRRAGAQRPNMKAEILIETEEDLAKRKFALEYCRQLTCKKLRIFHE